MSSHGAPMLDDPDVFGVFAAFALIPTRPDGRKQSDSPAITSNEVETLLTDYGDEVLVDTYVTRGLMAETDYLLRVHARELTTAQAFLQEFRATALGRHSRQTEAFIGLIREAVYTPAAPDLDEELKTATYDGPDPPRYAIVIPARKTAEWWTLSDEEQLELMRDHIEPTLEFLDRVRRQLYHASGLCDLDFITYFETDDLVAFTDLVRELQSIPEYRYVQYGDPTLIGRIHDPATAVDRLTDSPVR